jgi:hypothetical protein
MFPGCTVQDVDDAKNRSIKRASLTNEQNMKVRWDGDSRFQFNLRRSQRFIQADAAFVNSVIGNLNLVAKLEKTPYFTELVGSAIRRSVASQAIPTATGLADGLLRDLELWSEETYEGKQISALLGIRGHPVANAEVDFRSITRQAYGKVVASSMDIIPTMNAGGRFCGYEMLPDENSEVGVMAPRRFARAARWASKGKVAMVLSRNGEILVFHNGELRFARRRGRWRHFRHRPLITRMGLNRTFPRDLCEAVYQSTLDVSFAKAGCCIALIRENELQRFSSKNLVSDDDRVDGPSRKSIYLRSAVRGKRFQKLPRPLRQTLLSMDGSMILQRDGTVVAVGAIIKVEAGSKSGGGRKAAAMALGAYGLGIKVSSDGEILGFNGIGQDQAPFFIFG